MKKWRIVIKGLLFCLAIAGIASCGPIPIVTIDWQDDGNGFIQFQTNDPANASQGFHILYPTTIHDPMTPVEVTLKKVNGSMGGGYGIVFCAVDDVNYYTILISRAGVFTIIKVINGSLQPPTRDWKYPVNAILHPGYNTENTIRVTRDPTGIFNVYFNNVWEDTFQDTLVSGGKSGFYVHVSDKITEYFPASMVDVRFKMLYPEEIP